MSTVVAEGTVRPRSKALNIVLWVLQVLVALALLGAGAAKLSGDQAMVAQFETIGLGQWFRYLTAALEVLGAILLLVPRLSGVGALLLSCVMAGAVVAHLVKLGGSPLPALVFLVMLLTIAWGRRGKTLALLGSG
jgi:putative oxidoreductase